VNETFKMNKIQVVTITIKTKPHSVNKDLKIINKTLNYQQVQGLAKSFLTRSPFLNIKRSSQISAWATPQ